MFFSRDHLMYAIPAIFCLATMVMIPPLLLIVYPLGWKALAMCGLSESKWVRGIPIERLKPLLDSFQSCFKDNFRFFAGLYFIYRVFAQVTYCLPYSFTFFYTTVEILLILMLMLHAVAQPYQKRWYNIVDTLLFTDLAIINGLSLYIYSKATDGTGNVYAKSIHSASIVQLIFIYLPLVYIAIYTIAQLTLKIKSFQDSRRDTPRPCSDDYELPARLLDGSDDGDSDIKPDYQPFHDAPMQHN